MAKTKYNVIVYHDTAANWATDTKIYGENIFMYATDTGVLKKGDGAKAYKDLGSIGSVATWGVITNQPAVIAAGADKAAARTAIDAADVAHDHAVVADVDSGLAAAANIQALAIALSARIKAHDHAVVADVDSGLAAAANIQALAIALSTRIKTLEDAP